MKHLFGDIDVQQRDQVGQSSARSQRNQSIVEHHFSTSRLDTSLDSTQQSEVIDQNTQQNSTESVSAEIDLHQNSKVIVPGNEDDSRQQIEPIGSLLINCHETSSGRKVVVAGDCEQAKQVVDDERAKEQSAAKAIDVETVDLISSEEEGEEEVVNYTTKGVGKAVDQLQPKTQPRNWTINNTNVSVHSKKNHKLVSAVEAKKRHECEFCEYSTEHKTSITLHIRTHTNERPYRCKVFHSKAPSHTPHANTS